MAGCYGPQSVIWYRVECPFRVHRSRSFSGRFQCQCLIQSGVPRTYRLRDGRANLSKTRPWRGRQDRATQFSFEKKRWACRQVHQVSSRMPSRMQRRGNAPSFPRMRESSGCQKAAQFSAEGCTWPPGTHGECIQTCTKHALIARSWCVPKTPRHPTGQASELEPRPSRACGNPVVVRKRPRSSVEGCTIAPGMPLKCIQTCTKHALIVRRVPRSWSLRQGRAGFGFRIWGPGIRPQLRKRPFTMKAAKNAKIWSRKIHLPGFSSRSSKGEEGFSRRH